MQKYFHLQNKLGEKKELRTKGWHSEYSHGQRVADLLSPGLLSLVTSQSYQGEKNTNIKYFSLAK